MKQFFTLFFLLLFFIQNSFAQTFVKEECKWNYIFGVWTTFHTRSYKFEGDTLINSETYKKVWVSFDSLNEDWQPFDDMPFARETPDRKVFGYRFGEEYQFYDFEAELGDTVGVYGDLEGVVVSLDTVFLLDDTPKKRWEIQIWTLGGESEFWIEDVGGENGFLFRYFLDTGEDFICYEEIGETLLQVIDTTCWVDFPVATQQETLETIDFQVFPNPTEDIINFSIFPSPIDNGSIRLMNLHGQIIKEIPSNQSVFSIKMLPKGIYFLHLYAEGNILKTKKIIKQ